MHDNILEGNSMGKKIHTTLRVDEENYKEAKKILERLGLNVSQAFNIFIAMIKETKGIPFEIKIPNEETQKVIKEARKGKNLTEIKDLDEFKKQTSKFVVLPIEGYEKLKEAELEKIIREGEKDYKAGRFIKEPAEEHFKKLKI